MKPVILDASVACKWFLSGRDEKNVDEAVELLRLFTKGKVRFEVPDLFFAEVGSVALRAERHKRSGRAICDQVIEQLLGMKLPAHPAAPLLQLAREIARRFNCAVYDSIYVALAVNRNGTVVTADEKLVAAAAAYLPVAWLGAFPI
ncbi:MAG: type II toxin-antitoxin system VapC family toxin [Bryobacteraceae bacterium]